MQRTEVLVEVRFHSTPSSAGTSGGRYKQTFVVVWLLHMVAGGFAGSAPEWPTWSAVC
jgi:hypothetical protein